MADGGRVELGAFQLDAGAFHCRFYGCASIFSSGSYWITTPLTEEERAEQARQAREWDQRQADARGAAERADALLKERLGWHRYKLFRMTGSLMRRSTLWPEVHYRIRRDAKVQVVRNGQVQTELCVVSAQGEPESDRIMSILDLVETDEAKLWEMANVFPIR